MTYNTKQIGWELERTAMADGYYGSALRAAMDLSCCGPEDRAVLQRYATGAQGGTDHVRLQEIAHKVYNFDENKNPLWKNADEQFIVDCLLHDITDYYSAGVFTGGDELDCQPTQDIEMIKSHLWQTDDATLLISDARRDTREGFIYLIFGEGGVIVDHTSNELINNLVARAEGALAHAKRKGWV